MNIRQYNRCKQMGSVPTFTRLHLKCRSVEPVLGSRGMHSPRTTTGTRRRRRPRMTYSGGVCGMDHRRVGDHASGDVVGSPPPPTTTAVQSRQQHRTRVIALPSYVLYVHHTIRVHDVYVCATAATTSTHAARGPRSSRTCFDRVAARRCRFHDNIPRERATLRRHRPLQIGVPNYQVLQSI